MAALDPARTIARRAPRSGSTPTLQRDRRPFARRDRRSMKASESGRTVQRDASRASHQTGSPPSQIDRGGMELVGAAARGASAARRASSRDARLVEHAAVVQLQHLIAAEHQRVRRRRATLSALSSASASATRAASKPAPCSPAFAASSSSAASTGSNGTPAASSIARRAALFEASTSLMPPLSAPHRSARCRA